MPRQDSNANVQGPAEAGLPLLLTTADFDAPDAAGESYLFERLLGWGAGMRVRLRGKRVPVDISAPSASEGARRLFFSRAHSRRSESATSLAAAAREERVDAAKAPIKRVKPAGAYLTLALTQEGVDVALEVPSKARAERGMIMDLLGDRNARGALIAAVRALPHPFVVGRADEPASARTLAQGITADVLLSILTASSKGSDALWIGWHVPRAVALAHAATLGGELEGALLSLAELFRAVAWTAAPAAAGGSAARTRAAVARERTRLRAQPEDAEDAADGDAESDADADADATGPGAAAGSGLSDAPPKQRKTAGAFGDGSGSLAKLAAAAAKEAPVGGGARAASRHKATLEPTKRTLLHSSASRSAGLSRPKVRLRSTLGRRTGAARLGKAGIDSTSPLERGTEVHVLAGPFEGRIGVVQELDGKGHARVLLGLLATRIALVDLSRPGKQEGPASERPSLASSHRKART